MLYVYLVDVVFILLPSLAVFRLKATVFRCRLCEYDRQGRGAVTLSSPRINHLQCVRPVMGRHK